MFFVAEPVEVVCGQSVESAVDEVALYILVSMLHRYILGRVIKESSLMCTETTRNLGTYDCYRFLSI